MGKISSKQKSDAEKLEMIISTGARMDMATPLGQVVSPQADCLEKIRIFRVFMMIIRMSPK